MVKEYYYLAKPGLVYGNLVTTIAGFLMGTVVTGGVLNFTTCFATVIGISLVMGSGCIFNNIIDRDIDVRMTRTKNRPTVTGEISKRAAIIYGAILGVIGIVVLAVGTNTLTTAIAIFGWFAYVVLYTFTKRITIWSTAIGSISGAVPPVIGYCAATGRLDVAAILLFVILIFWQIPHFYAIGIYRLADYKNADIPILPVQKGIAKTKEAILLYVIAFAVVAPLLARFARLGAVYFIISLLLGLTWLALCIQGYWARDEKRWARQMFFLSLIVMTTLFMTIAISSLISVFYAGFR